MALPKFRKKESKEPRKEEMMESRMPPMARKRMEMKEGPHMAKGGMVRKGKRGC